LSLEANPFTVLSVATMDQDHDQLSALMDGELSEAETALMLREMAGQPDTASRWERYHMIGDALRSNLPPYLCLDLRARVGTELTKEPTVLSPGALPRRRLPTGLRQAAGVAIAASVAVVAVLGARVINRADLPAAPEVAAVIPASNPPASGPVPLQRTSAQVSFRSLPVNSRLDSYFVNHHEYAASSGMLGILPYVSLVGQEDPD
jgi:sigma-E factor negative regulatory protein RseA